MGVEIDEVLDKYPYPDHLLKAIGNGNIQLLEENLGRDAMQYTLRHITGRRYYMNMRITTSIRGSGIVHGPSTSVKGFLDFCEAM